MSNKPDRHIQTLLKIRELNDKKQPTNYTTLIKELPELSRVDINCAIDTLGDWDLIRGGYEEVGKGRVGYCYHVTSSAIYWLDEYGKTHTSPVVNKKSGNEQ
jgi:hypothetical protein